MTTPPRSNEAIADYYANNAVTLSHWVANAKGLRNGILAAITEATAAREAELAKFRALHTNAVPGPEGMGEEVPATPESTAAYIAELHGEWDDAEKRIQALTVERDALKAENEKIHQSLVIVMQERRLSRGPDFLRELLAERDNLTDLRAANSALVEENKFLHDLLDAFNWRRINSLSVEEVEKELSEKGHSAEKLKCGMDKIRAMFAAHKFAGGGEKASSTSDAADAKNTAIEDAAVEVAAFSRTHGWPKERSIEFFEFAQKLDVLATCLGKKYPYFNKCMSHQPEGGK